MFNSDVVIPSRLSWEEFSERVHKLVTIKARLPWAVGDLVNFGVARWGERAWQALSDFREVYTDATISNYASIARKFPPEERSMEVAFSVYQAVGALPKPQRDELITEYLGGKKTRQEIREMAGSKVNGASNGSEALAPLKTQMAGMFEAVGRSMLVVIKLMKHDDEENLKEALDELIANAMALREILP